MRNLIKSLMLVATVATAFVACSTDTTNDIDTPVVKEGYAITFTASDETRSVLEDNRIVWESGDKAGVSFYYAEAVVSGSVNKEATVDTATTPASFTATMGETPRAGEILTAYYPYADYDVASYNVTHAPLTIPAKQALKSGNKLDGKNMPMFGVPYTYSEDAVSANITPSIPFYHTAGIVSLSLTDVANEYKDEVVETVKIEATGITGTNYCDLTQTTADAIIESISAGETNNSVTLTPYAGTTLSEVTNLMLAVNPGEYTDSSVTFTINTDKAVYTKVVDASSTNIVVNRANITKISIAFANLTRFEKIIHEINPNTIFSPELTAAKYQDQASCTIDSISYSAAYLMKNAKSGVAGKLSAQGMFLQAKKNDGYIKNTTSKQIKSIIVYEHPACSGFTLSTGQTTETLTDQTGVKTTTTVTIKDKDDKDLEQELNVYTYDLSSSLPKYFKLSATAALWIYKIEFVYISGTNEPSTPEPEPGQLATPTIASFDVTAESLSASWSKVANATGYEWCLQVPNGTGDPIIYSSAALGEVGMDASGTNVTLSLTPTDILTGPTEFPEGEYVLYVKAVDTNETYASSAEAEKSCSLSAGGGGGAEPINIELDLTDDNTYPTGFPTSKGTSSWEGALGGYEFSMNGYGSDGGVYKGSSNKYLMIGKCSTSQSCSIVFPAIDGYKLTSVTIGTSSSSSTNVKISVRDTVKNNTTTGGDEWTVSTNTGHTYTLTGTTANTKYLLYLIATGGSRNTQLTKLNLTYTPVND